MAKKTTKKKPSKSTSSKKTTKKAAKKPSARLTLAKVSAKLDALEKRLDLLEDRLSACEADLTELYDCVFGDAKVSTYIPFEDALTKIKDDEYDDYQDSTSLGKKWRDFWGYLGEKLSITKVKD